MVNIIENVFSRVTPPAGFLGLQLVECSTGHVLAALPAPGGEQAPGAHAAGWLSAAATEAVQYLSDMAAAQPPLPLPHGAAATDAPDALGDVMITTTRHHHLIRVLSGLAGTDAFLLLTLDRAHANLALARHLLLAFEVGLVA